MLNKLCQNKIYSLNLILDFIRKINVFPWFFFSLIHLASKIFSRPRMIKLFKRDFLRFYAQGESLHSLVTRWPKVDPLPAGGPTDILKPWGPEAEGESEAHPLTWLHASWGKQVGCITVTAGDILLYRPRGTRCPRNTCQMERGLKHWYESQPIHIWATYSCVRVFTTHVSDWNLCVFIKVSKAEGGGTFELTLFSSYFVQVAWHRCGLRKWLVVCWRIQKY